MSARDLDDAALRAATGLHRPAPPPAPELLRALEGMKPVRTRSRFGAFAAVALAALVAPALALGYLPWRRDLAALPRAWVILGAGLWGLAALLSLGAALIPRPRDVLPAPDRASRIGMGAMVALLLFALFATVRVPGVSMRPADLGWSLSRSCVHCVSFVVKIAAVVLAAGLLALRRLVPVGGARMGMALGAAGGALGGLVLHFLCPIATTAHVVLAHVGGMALMAAAGALLLPRALKR